MLEKNIILALNGTDDDFLEETARRLGYSTETKEAVMADYRKGRSRRFVSILIAACLLLSLGIAAYATEFFGIKAMLIKNTDEMSVPDDFSAMVSITQPQEVPEGMSADIKQKIENSSRAWAEWDAWSEKNGIQRPKAFDPPEGISLVDCIEEHIENGDGSYTVIFYKKTGEPVFDEDGKYAGVEQEEIERRTVTAEEYEQNEKYYEAISKGYEGYDFNYNVYSQEMADKLEEIAASYGLRLRHGQTVMYENFGEFTQFNTFEELMDRINQVCAGGNTFFRTEPTGFDKFYYFDEGTFAVSFYTTDEKTDMGTNTGTSCYLYNSPYGTLSSGFEIVSWVKDIDAMSSYTHTSPDGTELTVLHNGADMFAYVYLENSFVTMHFNQPEGLSSDEINSIIDMVNFSAIK